mmetsp:Transcript_4785/g.12854  ORF Transcript_4785/g.12854 Transcript_4785/m.12854 type:complete len:439 (+) Transcript_4785:94-1410(+)
MSFDGSLLLPESRVSYVALADGLEPPLGANTAGLDQAVAPRDEKSRQSIVEQVGCGRMFGLSCLSIIAGAFLVVQLGVSAALSPYAGHGLYVSTFNFAQATTILGLLACTVMTAPRGEAILEQTGRDTCCRVMVGMDCGWVRLLGPLCGPGRMPLWQWIGGLLGAFAVTSGIVISPILGMALYTMLVIFGNIVSSLFLDAVGFPKERPLTLFKVLGGVLVTLGTVMSFNFFIGGGLPAVGWSGILTCIIPVVVGCNMPIQSAINQLLAHRVRGNMRAAFVSNIVATIGCTVASLIPYWLLHDDVTFGRMGEASWWMWTGGVWGVAFLFFSISIPRVVGVTLFFVMFIFGQLMMSLFVDEFGVFSVRHPASIQRILGVLTVFLGVVSTCVPQRHGNRVDMSKKTDDEEDNGYQQASEPALVHTGSTQATASPHDSLEGA